ncbi:hypothetical protein BJX99DRAFT_256578 [Aspergillus californicus]
MRSDGFSTTRTIAVDLRIVSQVRDHDTHDLAALRRVNRSWLEVASAVLFEDLTIVLQNEKEPLGGYMQQLFAEFHEGGYGNLYLRHARNLSIVCIPDVRRFKEEGLDLSKHLKDMRGNNLFAQIPQVAVSSFLEDFCLSGVTPDSDPQRPGFAMNLFWKEDWQPLVTLISRLQCLTQVNYGLRNLLPKVIYQAIVRYHPSSVLNVWSGNSPLNYPPPNQLFFLNSNPVYGPLPPLDGYSLSRLQSYAPLCPVGTRHVVPRMYWKYMTRHFADLAACRSLQHLDPSLDSRWGEYDEISQATDRWTAIPAPQARAPLQSLRISGQSPNESVLVDLAGIFDLSSTLRSLDIEVWEHPTLLRDLAPRLPSLQRLFISLDTKLNQDPDLTTDNSGIIEAILAFNPLQYLCLRAVRNITTLHTILNRHGPTLHGLIIEPLTTGRSGLGVMDAHFKFPHITDSDILHLAKSAPHLRELRLPLKRTKGNKHECAMYKSLGSFTNLRSLLLDLHYDIRTAPIDRQWRPSVPELKEILVNAATDADLAHSIWTLISGSQPGHALRNLTVHPFGSPCFQMPEAYLLMSVGQSFLVQRPAFDAFEPLEIKRVGEGQYMVDVELRLGEGNGPGRAGRLTKFLHKVFDEVWPGGDRWDVQWRSFPLRQDEE